MNILDRLSTKWLDYRQDKRIEAMRDDPELGEEWKLHKVVSGSKECEIIMEHPSIYIFADEAAAFLKDSDAENYVQFDMMPRLDRGKKPIRVTVQWAKGESPAQQNARLRTELEALRARLTATETALTAAKNLLGMSSPETSAGGDGVRRCDYCDNVWYDEHKEDCEFRQAKALYFDTLTKLGEFEK